MALGLAQDLAEYLAEQLGLGLYDDPDVSLRVIFVQMQPPVPEEVDPLPTYGIETTNPLAICVFDDGGAPGTLNLSTENSVTIQTRHALYATAMTTQGSVNEILNENGGAGISKIRQGKFGGNRISLIRANFPPQPLGRDPAPRDGRQIVTQTFTVRAFAPTVFS